MSGREPSDLAKIALGVRMETPCNQPGLESFTSR